MSEEEQLVADVLDIGEGMLLSGAEVSRVEDAVIRLLHAYGSVKTDVITILSNIEVTATFPEGERITELRRIRAAEYDIDYRALESWNALSRRLCASPLDRTARQREIEGIRAECLATKKRKCLRAAGYILSAAVFTMFFGGGIEQALAAACGGGVLYGCSRLFDKLYLQNLLKIFLLSFIGGVLCIPPALLKLEVGPIAVGYIMLVIPGVAITVSVRDMLTGDTISGALRMLESLVSTCFIGIGLAVAMLLSGGLISGSGMTGLAERPLMQVITAGLGATAFSLLYQTEPKRYFLCLCAGALAWSVFLLAERADMGLFLANLCAGAVGTLFAECMARLKKLPATVVLAAAIIPLVPGRTLYLTMDSIVHGASAAAVQYAETTAVVAFGVAAGTVLISSAYRSFALFRQKKSTGA